MGLASRLEFAEDTMVRCDGGLGEDESDGLGQGAGEVPSASSGASLWAPKRR